ncbi:MAG TPA: radical SAM protein [Candidatus Bathyarchaeia archaeon]|nr:radical SAM protein [Candidatus Bathyarchaeia archaeon]
MRVKSFLKIIKLSVLSFGKIKSVGMEVTNKCNLNCLHCFRKNSKSQDLPEDKWIKVFRSLIKQGTISMAYVGGEPLLRQDLIKIGKKYFPVNMIITNGTIPLPDWKDVTFGVSVDGTKKYHEKIRGNGFNGKQYDLIKKNILDGAAKGLKIYILMTISKENKDNIEDFYKEWSETEVAGVIYDFYTPQKGEDDTLCLTFSERDRVIDKLKTLRLKRPKFMPWNSERILQKMSSRQAGKWIKKCSAKFKTRLNLNFEGKKLYPCQMGSPDQKKVTIDCSRCGCMIAYLDVKDTVLAIEMFR